MTVKTGAMLRAYLGASHLITLAAPMLLARRRRRGKEDPARWVEKTARALAPRPAGRLVWLHGVGLGEVLSLRGLIARMAAAAPDLQFVVTSSTAASAAVFGAQLPARTLHQFLPLDAPPYRRRFVDHFHPDLCIWAEQDLWPGFVHDLHRRAVPQAIVAARMDDAAFARHRRAGALFGDLYARMALISAQDAVSRAHLAALGARAVLGGSLKPAAPPLACDAAALAQLGAVVAGRFVWAVAPAHDADMALALAAHDLLRAQMPDALLIIAPRHPARPMPIAAPRRSQGALPRAHDPIWLCDTFGDLGLVYRLARAALIGGTQDATQGHNPWEAAGLDCAILHGPQTANFAADFAALAAAGAALPVHSAAQLATALLRPDLPDLAAAARASASAAARACDALALDLIGLLPDAR